MPGRPKPGTLHYLVSAVGAFALLALAHLYPLWQPLTGGVVTTAWPRLLWALDAALLVQLLGNLALAANRPEWLRLTFRWLFAGGDLLLACALVAVFPFELSRLGGPWLELAVRLGFILGIAVSSVRLLFRTVMLILGPPPAHPHGV